MPVRRDWAAALAEAEPIVESLAIDVANSASSVPVDLRSIAAQVGASVFVRRSRSRHGSVEQDGERYRVVVNVGDDARVNHRHRFTIAHELAHVLFLRADVAPPVGSSEYWRLEEACNRIAGRLLVPRWFVPAGALDASDVPGWIQALISRAGLSPPAASKELVRSVANAVGTAGVKVDDSGRPTVAWSMTVEGGAALPGVSAILSQDSELARVASMAVRTGQAAIRVEDHQRLQMVATPLKGSVAIVILRSAAPSDQLSLFDCRP